MVGEHLERDLEQESEDDRVEESEDQEETVNGLLPDEVMEKQDHGTYCRNDQGSSGHRYQVLHPG